MKFSVMLFLVLCNIQLTTEVEDVAIVSRIEKCTWRYVYIYLAGVGALGFAIWDIADIEFTRANSRTGSAGPNAKRWLF